MTDTNPLLTRHTEALALFGDRVHTVRDDQWNAPTPCTDWTVRDLVSHLVSEQLWVPAMVRDGATVEEIGDAFDGDVLGSDPAAAWDRSADAAHAAFAEPDALDRVVRLSYADTTAAFYCSQMVADLTVHTWDLSHAIGADERLPDDLLRFTVREVTPYAADLAKTGLFAAPVEPPPGADVQTKLLCLMGRTP
ncbi:MULTISPECIES: TIGR03086 family metal-binding protein [Streptomyces]|uniref:TIGR03086 family protein n=1 Tax=Streptomyces dengpaensis TaxID=2049881 RepID=A0ABM6T1U5_9ACTN|nr:MULTISPECIES: TIGR03086 family metal-binding protein [Streptomyces]AVH61004.1 TIGR03086 family protein [Streptomyces dengpaensis]PIB12258.1 TIGR03086 family protein [Streptomyces sp. HG99]